MTKPKKPNFSPEFRLETAQLVVDNGYTHQGAAKAMGVGYSISDNSAFSSVGFKTLCFVSLSINL
jgi:hypothetical protein